MGPYRSALLAVVTLGACTSAPAITPHAFTARDVAVSPPAPVVETAPAPCITDSTRERAAQRLRERIARTQLRTSYVVASALIRLDVAIDAEATVACSVEVAASPPTAEGGERWEGGRTAIAVGRAHVTSSASPHEVELSIDACVDSAGDQVLTGRVMPFLERSVAAR